MSLQQPTKSEGQRPKSVRGIYFIVVCALYFQHISKYLLSIYLVRPSFHLQTHSGRYCDLLLLSCVPIRAINSSFVALIHTFSLLLIFLVFIIYSSPTIHSL